jgi:hypothetical protein
MKGITMSNRVWNAFGVENRINGSDETRWTRIDMSERMMKFRGATTYSHIRIVEDEDGDYKGWVDRDPDTGELLNEAIAFVTFGQFYEINFPDGSAEKVRKGQGVTVQVRIEARE